MKDMKNINVLPSLLLTQWRQRKPKIFRLEHTASNGGSITGDWSAKSVEGSSRGKIVNTVPTLSWKDPRRQWKPH